MRLWGLMVRLAVVGMMLAGAGGVRADDGGSTFSLNMADVPSTTTDPNSFKVEEVAKDLRVPWSILFPDKDRVLFNERPGRVRVIEKGVLRPEPLLTLPDVYPDGKMGLLGMTLHPAFAQNRWLYMSYCYGDAKKQHLRVVRYTETSNTLSDRHLIIDNVEAAPSHAGCRLAFGPDGKLYITTGDAGIPEISQKMDSLGGKTLRLNEDGSVPQDNPFVGTPNARAEIWSLGHRNAQGLVFQPGTGLQFQSEHGPSGPDGPGGGDEINIVERGKNYGWPVVHHRVNKKGMEPPLLEYTPAIAPGSTIFYNGNAFPQFKGNLFVGCMGVSSILRVVLDGKKPVAQERMLDKQYGRIREVVEAPDGSIYFSTSQHDVEVKVPAPGADRILRLVPH